MSTAGGIVAQVTAAAHEVLADMAPRLRAARAEVDDARLALALAITRRNELVVAAVDQGMRGSAVAAAAGVKPPHVIRILAETGQ